MEKFKYTKIVTSFLAVTIFSTVSYAAPRDQAKRLYASLTGNTPNKAEADRYEKILTEDGPDIAARQIIEGNHGFYNVTLKNFYTPMSNEDGTQFAELNDMTTLLIGATRDEIDFFRVFWDNILYQFDGPLIPNSDVKSEPVTIAAGLPYAGVVIPAIALQEYTQNDHYWLEEFQVAIPKYNPTKNDMYKKAEQYNIPLSNKKYLVSGTQYNFTVRNSEAIAGIFSTKAWGEAYYTAGTNRASFAYFAKNFMCLEMEELNDTTIADFRVRKDVDRAPGGKTETYKTFCVGCHAGQDALGGAFAYYDYSGKIVYKEHENNDGDYVAPKINANVLYTEGKLTQSDSWINLWNEGQNAYVGWGSATSGNGVKSLGKMLSETKQVRTCLADQVFAKVCGRKAESPEDKNLINVLATKFDEDKNMKNLFINASIACSGV